MGKGGFNSQKIFKYVRLAALLGPGAYMAMQPNTPADKIAEVLRIYTGYDMRSGAFHAQKLGQGWGPYLAAVATTYGIPKLAGIIRGL